MKLNIFKIYKSVVFCLLLSLKSMLVLAQAPVPQFLQLNSSPNTLTWDNTPWNNKIDNGNGTFSPTAVNWMGSGRSYKYLPYKNIAFGGALGIGAAGTITLSAPLNNVKSIAFHPAASGNFTLTGASITSYASNANLDVSVDSGLSPTIFSPFTGTYSFTKKGLGTLILTHNNNFSGNTSVTEGTLQIGAGSTGTITSPNIDISSGATLMFNNGAYAITLNNNLSGVGTIRFQGNNSSINKDVSTYQLRGNNSGFSGNIKINRTALWLTNLQTQLGSAVISVEQGGMLLLQTNVFNNTITLEDKCGWYNSNPTANVLGGLWFYQGGSISGNLILNNTTNVIMGDTSGENSAMAVWDGGNSTISGRISGPGNLAVSRYAGAFTTGGAPPPPSNISLTGNVSNDYTGITVVNGQQGLASLFLRKTGGAVAIPANGTVWMGNNTVGVANLRMGNDANTGNTTGATRNQWNNQFGANVLMQFNNTAANLMRFDLQGTNQTLAGLNCGNTSTAGGGAVQNQGANGFNPANPATLTLNGSGNYVYNGIMRDQEIGTTNKLNLVWSGTGSQTLVGASINYTGTTNVSNTGRLVCYNTTAYKSNTTINAGGTYEMNVPSGALTVPASYTINGTGLLVKSGTGNWAIGSGSNFVSMAMNGGGMFDIQAGTVLNANSNDEWVNNKGSVNVSATLDIKSNIYVDALTGSGTINNSNADLLSTKNIYVGVSNTTNNTTYGVTGNTATFSGVINDGGILGGVTTVVKQGTGTQIFSGNNAYSGGTTINGGTLKMGSANALGTTGTITVNPGGVLDRNGYGNVLFNLRIVNNAGPGGVIN